MNDKKIDQIANDLIAIKSLLVLQLQHQGVKVEIIAKALKVSRGRVSQIAPTKQYKKRRGVSNG